MPNVDERLRGAGEALAERADPSRAQDRVLAQANQGPRRVSRARVPALVVVVVAAVVAGTYGLAGLFTASGGGPVGRSPTSSDLTASNFADAPRADALAEAKRLVRLVAVPPGAIEVASAPVLRQPGETFLTPYLLDVPRWWTVPMSMSDALAWMRSHPPAGSGRPGADRGAGREGRPARC